VLLNQPTLKIDRYPRRSQTGCSSTLIIDDGTAKGLFKIQGHGCAKVEVLIAAVLTVFAQIAAFESITANPIMDSNLWGQSSETVSRAFDALSQMGIGFIGGRSCTKLLRGRHGNNIINVNHIA
jgi:hypothetical protein